jgi:branched-chain amino acid transport system ATP-binding protein
MSLLETRKLSAFYGDFQALFDVDVGVEDGETVAIIGANGAGKTTFLRSVAGALKNAPDAVMFDGAPIGGRTPHEIVRLGVAMVPEGRKLFPSLSVEENLLVGSHCGRAGPWSLQRVYELFPRIAELRRLPATALSGGQQQMAAIGRALMCNPRLLLCDELSLGLAPVVIRDIYQCLGAITREGTTVVLVEQDINRALDASARFYCFQEGRLALSAPTKDFDRSALTAAYFGLEGRRADGLA